jgi:peptide deformylase
VIHILQNKNEKEDEVLRNDCKPVRKQEFGTPELRDLVEKMQEAAHQEPDGVALAAPQIGANKTIFVIDERAYDDEAKFRPLVFINPEIVKASKKQEIKEEGCLSVRGIWGKTWRSTTVTVKAYNVDGHPFTFGATGLIAHIIQHECDHLDGTLFIDHGFDFSEYDPYAINHEQKHD